MTRPMTDGVGAIGAVRHPYKVYGAAMVAACSG